jgi:hypothetical protein
LRLFDLLLSQYRGRTAQKRAPAVTDVAEATNMTTDKGSEREARNEECNHAAEQQGCRRDA